MSGTPGRKAVLTAVAVLVVAGVALVLSAGTRGTGPTARLALAGSTAPRLVGTSLAGAPVDLARWRGSVVLVNVWASWCGPCRDELPLLVATQRSLAPRGLRVLGVATRDGPVASRALLAELDAGALESVSDPDGSIAVTWGATGVPETFVVDRAGVVRARRVGPLTEDWVHEHVDPLLGL